MKAIAIAICLLLLSSSAWAAPALVQHAQGGTTGGTSANVALPSVVSGHLITLQIVYESNGTLSSLIDSNGTLSSCVTLAGTSFSKAGIYYETSAAAGSHTLTATVSTSGAIRLYAAEYSGTDPSGACYAATAVATGTSASPATASLTPTETGDLAIGIVNYGGAGTTVSSWGSPLAQVDDFVGNGGSAWADAVLASTSAVNASATLSASAAWATAFALFKPAAGSSCTHSAWLQNGTIAVPTASSTVVWRKDGSFGTVDCSTTQYYQPSNGGAFGVN